MTDDFPLAAEFPRTTRAGWRKLVDAALKGAAFDKRLVTHTYDGLRIEPLYGRAAGAKPVAGRAPHLLVPVDPGAHVGVIHGRMVPRRRPRSRPNW